MVKQKYKGFSGCFELILKYYLYTADDNIRQKITLHMIQKIWFFSEKKGGHMHSYRPIKCKIFLSKMNDGFN